MCHELLLSAMARKGRERRDGKLSSTASVVSALAPPVIEQVTSLRERGVTECILSGHGGASEELVVTASDVVWCFGGSYWST